MTDKLGMFDLTRWKPITPVQYIDEFGSLFLTIDEPEEVKTTSETLPSGAIRCVTSATVLYPGNREPVAEFEPYLLMIFYPESDHQRPNLCFKRTDVELALS